MLIERVDYNSQGDVHWKQRNKMLTVHHTKHDKTLNDSLAVRHCYSSAYTNMHDGRVNSDVHRNLQHTYMMEGVAYKLPEAFQLSSGHAVGLGKHRQHWYLLHKHTHHIPPGAKLVLL